MPGSLTTLIESNLRRAGRLLMDADAVLIGAGAGMSVDSGLPDYRGTRGFWTAYPAFAGRTYAEIAGPTLMQDKPEQAWPSSVTASSCIEKHPLMSAISN
ncbi:MAG: hypothetical protein IPM93_04615 [Candidatus Obscuribacter sp.]|nr:hypothetical protein [Candidatus Obscuribacter sp.]